MVTFIINNQVRIIYGFSSLATPRGARSYNNHWNDFADGRFPAKFLRLAERGRCASEKNKPKIATDKATAIPTFLAA